MTMVVYYLPTYFQGSKGTSAIRSGVLLFPTAAMIAPVAILIGQSVERTGHYLIQNYIGWALVMIGYGTLSLLTANSSIAMGSGLQIIGAMGLGVLYVGPNFALLAPLAVEDNAHALALMSYLRTFGQCVVLLLNTPFSLLTDYNSIRTFGVTLGTTILQNGLKSRLPSTFLSQFPSGAEISYAIIPLIKSLPDPVLRAQVKAAFAGSISVIWLWVVGLAAAGLIATLPMRQWSLATTLDGNWGLETPAMIGDESEKVVNPEAKMEKGEFQNPVPTSTKNGTGLPT